jgi:hypothetical protein
MFSPVPLVTVNPLVPTYEWWALLMKQVTVTEASNGYFAICYCALKKVNNYFASRFWALKKINK